MGLVALHVGSSWITDPTRVPDICWKIFTTGPTGKFLWGAFKLYPCPGCALTKLGHVVDERVSLTVSVQISQLSAAVESQVVDAEPSLPCTAGVEQGTLGGE